MADRFISDERFQWLLERSEWIEKSSDPCFGLGPVAILCLEERQDHVNQFLETNQLRGRVSILRAFQPESLDWDELADLGIIAAKGQGFSSPGVNPRELCCSLGHLAIWLDAYRSGHETTIVLEDDLLLADQHESVATLMESANSSPWDLFYFSFSYADKKRSVQISDELLRIQGQLTTNAYAIRQEGRTRALQSFLPIRKAGDIYLRDLAAEYDLLVLASSQPYFDQDRSLIGSSIKIDRKFPPPRWNPLLRQKLLSRAFSLMTGTGAAGYDEGIHWIDRFRAGRLSPEERELPLLRIWALLDRFFPHSSN